MEDSKDYYTAEEVAKVLRLHPYTVRRLCREKRVPAFKFGGQWRFRREDIEKSVNMGVRVANDAK